MKGQIVTGWGGRGKGADRYYSCGVVKGGDSNVTIPLPSRVGYPPPRQEDTQAQAYEQAWHNPSMPQPRTSMAYHIIQVEAPSPLVDGLQNCNDLAVAA